MLLEMLGAGRAAAGAGQPPGEGREQTQVSRLQWRGWGGAVSRALLHLQPWTLANCPCGLGLKTEASRASWERIPVLLGTSARGLVVKTSSYKDP